MAVARPAAYGQAFFVVLAFVSLATSFVQNDFSVLYVAANSNSALPLVYRISAVWGAHEGSLLLWTLMLSLWTVAVARFSRSLPHVLVARVIAVMGFISVGFLLFMLLTSNPFARLFPAALDGRDLNPLLQDPGLAIHPPMLYMGYVGFSVAFSFAIAALLGGSLDATWARWSRPWTTVAWSFLTLGIALGSWWAYYELGWGGWWFWDPVENASFMPWLVGTALIHSLAVSEKRGAFKAWTVLLAIFAFSLSLLGTFLVRSGVLVSVHAFATDPERGVFILAFLAVVIGGSLSLYAWRGPATRGGGDFRLVSRESMLLVMNILLVNAAFTVLLGTLFPLIMDALQAGKISVGPPYFQMVFVPLMLPVLVLVGFLPHVRWKSSDPREAFQRMWLLMVISVVLAGALLWIAVGKTTFMVLLGVSLALWVMLSTLKGVWLRVADKPGRLQALLALPRGFYGMSLAHFGVGVFVIGVTLTSSYSIEQDIRMATGEEVTVAGYQFRFEGVERVAGANYAAERGKLGVMRDGNLLTTLQPEKRIYKVQQSGMTEAAIDAGLFRDLYVAMGEPLGQDAWSIRIQYKPFVRWIWLGCLFMFAGGLVAISDRRYRLLARRQGSVPANAMAAESGS
jgi:cytochrome c-type biogenesis protein CcmF